MPSRRSLLLGLACGAVASRCGPSLAGARSMSLLEGPIEIDGDWGRMIPNSVHAVLERMRRACLDGIRLVSDDQPERLRVTERAFGPPSVWLHADNTRVGWVDVAVGERDWSRLAYQFGHELGHVTANSWRPNAKPATPCQWLEEAMVEAFSLHGLTRLADDWSRDPPFTDDSGFGAAIATYRQDVVQRYGKLAKDQRHADDPAAWFAAHRPQIEGQLGLTPFGQAFCPTILAEYERNPACFEALGALNRWPRRSALPAEAYFAAWERSCVELGASPALPTWLRKTLAIA